jgi:predicted nucleic acid-binding protein
LTALGARVEVVMNGALLDTSVLIVSDGDTLMLPPTAAVSVVSIGELHAGVLRAPQDGIRAARQARLDAVRAAFLPIPVDERIAEEYGRALAHARNERQAEKATDLLIIATAAATGRELHTLDERQARLALGLGIAVAGTR